MSKVETHGDLGSIKDTTTFMRFCSSFLSDVTDVINGQLEFSLNIKSQVVSVTFNTANSDVTVTHTLNKTGVNFLVANKDVACDIYHGSQSDTSSTIYVRSTVAPATVVLVLF